MKSIRMLILAGALGLLPGCVSTGAPDSSATADNHETFDFGGPGRGAVVFKTTSTGLICASSNIGFSIEQKIPDGVEPRKKGFRISNYLYNEQMLAGITLPAGNYVVDAIYCTGNRTTRHMNGNFARFSVKEGEIAKIGVLDYRFTPDSVIGFGASGTVDFLVRPFNEAEIEYLERRLPAAKSMMVNRVMTPIEPSRRFMR